MSEIVEAKLSCDDCGSSDGLHIYDDGHSFCFVCETHRWLDDSNERKTVGTSEKLDLLDEGQYLDLKSRGISAKTCRRMNTSDVPGEGLVHNLFNENGRATAQKIRTKDKKFQVRGKLRDSGLFGQYRPFTAGGNRVVITEGELDALSYAEVTNGTWPVVSVTSGSSGAKRDIARNIEWLSTFDEIVLWFDDDDAGRKAVEEVAPILPNGKVKIAWASEGHKDASDMLQAGLVKEMKQIVWNAESYTPSGIVSLKDIKEDILRPVEAGYEWPWKVLTDLTYGRREGEIYALGAGTGIGKSDVFMTIIEQTAVGLGRPVGLFLLEMEPHEIGKRLAGKQAGKRFHVPDDGWNPDELVEALDAIDPNGDRVYIYDHFGSADWDKIEAHIRYLVTAHGVKDIFLDHLTALAADAEDERKELERIMAKMGGLVKELKFTLYFISHLATPDGKPHEEGGRVFIRHFKGSRAIGYWSHYMFGLERDQQAGEDERHTTTFRVLKDRYTGQATGCTFNLKYEADSGKLNHIETPSEDDFDDSY